MEFRTPLHSDVYGSFSWSSNIVGRKRWILIPAGQEEKLRTKGKIPSDLAKIDLVSIGINYLEVIQSQGEVIFVPSGWYHQVWNEEDTISINHNWFNGANIEQIYQGLVLASKEVQKEFQDFSIDDDCKEQFELVLRCHHGMNFEDFIKLLESVIQVRQQQSLNTGGSSICTSCNGGMLCDVLSHIKWDLTIATNLLDKLKTRQT